MHAKVWEALKWNTKANTSATIENTLWKKELVLFRQEVVFYGSMLPFFFFWPLFRSGALYISSSILSRAHWPPVNRQDSFHFNQVFIHHIFFFMHKELVWVIYLTTKNYITVHPRIMPKMSPNTPVKIEIFMVFYVLWSSLEIWPFSYWLNCNFSKTAYNWII